MSPRLNYPRVAPEGLQAMMGLENYVRECGLEHRLIGLVKLRASQINGCAYCIDMHAKDLRAEGETEQRIYGLTAWRETPYYTARERAALEWTEAVTLIADTHADDAIFERVRPHFNDKELADLTWAIAAINAWNRIAVSFRPTPGSYRSPKNVSCE